jgi:hypothetical protein
MRLREYEEEFEGSCPMSHAEARRWREGWGLWLRDDGFHQIQKFDADPKETFQTDEQAVRHVRAMARKGSTFHLRAAALHRRPY